MLRDVARSHTAPFDDGARSRPTRKHLLNASRLGLDMTFVRCHWVCHCVHDPSQELEFYGTTFITADEQDES